MSSNKFRELAKKIAERDKQVFDNLMEFEKTKKIRTKERVNFTIDKGIISKFRKLSKEKGYNMSAKVENMIKSLLEEY
jgi:hypothetical protein